MSSMEDKERKFFKELFLFIIVALMFLAAFLWDDSVKLEEKLKGVTNEQTIGHDAERSPRHNI